MQNSKVSAIDGINGRDRRQLIGLGHEVKLMPPYYVRPYVKRGKNDAADASGSILTSAVGATTPRRGRR